MFTNARPTISCVALRLRSWVCTRVYVCKCGFALPVCKVRVGVLCIRVGCMCGEAWVGAGGCVRACTLCVVVCVCAGKTTLSYSGLCRSFSTPRRGGLSNDDGDDDDGDASPAATSHSSVTF